jgi:hypothetical protein
MRRTTGADLGDSRLENTGAADGTTGALMFGAGGGAILAALPMPLGSLIELLTPPTLPGPCGIPLTPASCAKAGTSPIEQTQNARANDADLPNIDHTPVSMGLTSRSARGSASACSRMQFRAGGAKKPRTMPGLLKARGRGFAVVRVYA